MCKSCGCGCGAKKGKPLYKCSVCGRTAAGPAKCCGKPMKKL